MEDTVEKVFIWIGIGGIGIVGLWFLWKLFLVWVGKMIKG